LLDAGLHLLVDSGLARPRDNREVIQALGEKGILSREFAREIEGMAGFRNLLVHRYSRVDPEIVYQHLQDRLHDFDSFLRYVQAYLDRHGT
jgi:uncharacterized protein YutE (UPF0331/DUF86 family)